MYDFSCFALPLVELTLNFIHRSKQPDRGEGLALCLRSSLVAENSKSFKNTTSC